MLSVLRRATSLLLATIMLTAALRLHAQRTVAYTCAVKPASFALKTRDLPVWELGGGILFTAGMTIDADGAPNAYGPRNKGLDYTANARGAHGWVALVTNKHGNPVRQKSGQYRGFYISTTSLQQRSVTDVGSPKRIVEHSKC